MSYVLLRVSQRSLSDGRIEEHSSNSMGGGIGHVVDRRYKSCCRGPFQEGYLSMPEVVARKFLFG